MPRAEHKRSRHDVPRPPSGRLRAEGREHLRLIIAQRSQVSADRAARSPMPERDRGKSRSAAEAQGGGACPGGV